MPEIIIDGKKFEVKEGKNLLDAILSLKIDLPYFCWHPALGSVGSCRQCAVKQFKNEEDKSGKLVMACMVPVQEGMLVSIDDEEAVKFRQSVIEWLMTNHPHDCPVCDEGGECHLQDMTVMSGHNYRKYRFKKRTHTNQYLGPFINHEMNRCIACYRCVRFYRDYAYGRDLNVFAAHNNVYFGRSEDGTLESEFSGNLVEVCPTGVFTDKTLKQHYTRKWDMTYAPSICHHCGVGCNTIAGERYGSLRKIQSRYNSEVNGYFICDRGRFGYEFVNDPERVRFAYEKKEGRLTQIHIEDAQKQAAEILKSHKTIGIGSPLASLESNFALRTLVGADNFYAGISDNDKAVMDKIISVRKDLPVKFPSLKEMEDADAVLILGEDLHNSAPMMALSVMQCIRNKPAETIASGLNIPSWQDAAVREAVQDAKSPVVEIYPGKTNIDEYTAFKLNYSPEDTTKTGFMLAKVISGQGDTKTDVAESVQKIAEILKSAKKPLIISGGSLRDTSIIEAASNIALSLSATNKNTMLAFTTPEVNSFGLNLLDPLPFSDAVKKVEEGEAEAAFILENDLFSREDAKIVDGLFEKCNKIISLDYLANRTSKKADIVFPSGSFAESSGTVVNHEGRAQRFYKVFKSGDEIKDGWKLLLDIGKQAGHPALEKLNLLDEVNGAMAAGFPIFEKLADIAPPPGYRIAGEKIAREPHRYSGRTAMHANKDVHEPKPPVDEDSPLSFTMEGFNGVPPSADVPYFWSPGWNSEQSINKYQIEVGGPLHGGAPGVRLFGVSDKKIEPFTEPEFKNANGSEVLIPVAKIFGSDPLSMRSPAVKKRAEAPHFIVNLNFIDKHSISKNSRLKVEVNGKTVELPVKADPGFPDGCIGITYGYEETGFIRFPASVKLSGVSG